MTMKVGNILWLILDGKVVGYQVIESNFATTKSCIQEYGYEELEKRI